MRGERRLQTFQFHSPTGSSSSEDSQSRGKLMASSRSGQDAHSAATYYPDATWAHRTPAASGVNPDRLKQAIEFAIAGEIKAPRGFVMNHYQTCGREPFGSAIGPIKERGEPTGI